MKMLVLLTTMGFYLQERELVYLKRMA